MQNGNFYHQVLKNGDGVDVVKMRGKELKKRRERRMTERDSESDRVEVKFASWAWLDKNKPAHCLMCF